MAKAFGRLETLRDPVSGTYRVLSVVEPYQRTTTSSRTAGSDRVTVIDDLVMVDLTDEHTRRRMEYWMKELGLL